MKFKAKSFLYIFRLLIIIILLAILLRGLDFSLLLQRLGKFNISIFIFLLGLQLGVRWFNSLQIDVSAKTYKVNIPIKRLFEINLITTFYSLFLPGDFISGGIGWLKMTNDGASKLGALAAIAVPRWINILLLFFIGLVLLIIENTISFGYVAWILIAGVFILGVGYWAFTTNLALRSYQHFITSLTTHNNQNKIILPMTRFGELWIEFNAMQARQHLKLFGYGLIMIIIGGVTHIIIVRELQIPLSWLTIIWIRSLILILGMLPISIGGFGIREVSLVYLLGFYGVDKETALAYSFILLSISVGVGLIGGVLELKDALSYGSKGELFRTNLMDWKKRVERKLNH